MKLCFICGQKNDDDDEFCCRCMNMLPASVDDSLDAYFIDQDDDKDAYDDGKDSE